MGSARDRAPELGRASNMPRPPLLTRPLPQRPSIGRAYPFRQCLAFLRTASARQRRRDPVHTGLSCSSIHQDEEALYAPHDPRQEGCSRSRGRFMTTTTGGG